MQERALKKTEFDFVDEVARILPMRMLGRLLGVPDEDGEWQFSVDAAGVPAIFHHRRNDEIYYYKYDSLTFELDEEPTLYTNE